MTRQSPDRLEYESRHYPLYPFLPLLPLGDPRWQRCRFATPRNTVRHRGYGAQWAIIDGRLFLTGFGGIAEDRHGFGRRSSTEKAGQAIGMIDVHEVDTPVPATWISSDLVCPSGQAAGTRWEDFIPEEFLLLRVVRGRVVKGMSTSNAERVADVNFAASKTLLDQLLSERRKSCPEMPPVRVEGLARALQKHDKPDRCSQLAGLLWHADKADLDVLISTLASTIDPDLLRWTAYALGRIGPDAAVAIPELKLALSTTRDPDVARAIAYALGGIGPPAAPDLAATVVMVESRCDETAKDQILHFVGNLEPSGHDMIDFLIAGMLASRYTSVRSRIAFGLGNMGVAAVLPLYTAFATTSDDEERAALARALGHVGPDASLALAMLLDTLQLAQSDKSRAVIAEAIAKVKLRSSASLSLLRVPFRKTRDSWALGRIADAAASLGRQAVDFLVEEFEAAGTDGRIQIARVLGDIGVNTASAVSCLAEAAKKSENGNLSREVATALQKIGAPANVVFTAQIAAVAYEPHGYWAVETLDRMKVGIEAGQRLRDQDVRDLVALLVKTGESPVGRSIARMLGTLGKVAADPLLIALEQVRAPSTRLVIFYALGQVGEPARSATDDAVAALAAAENDPVRLQMVDDLIKMGRPDEIHLATLAEVLVSSSFLPVWWRLGLALAGIGAPAVATIVSILDRAKDEGQCRAMENALLELATTDASARGALLTAIRFATGPRTKEALQAALHRSIQR